MEISNIAKYYLLNFLYVPICIIYAYIIGEDTNTILLFIILALLVSFLVYLFDLVFTAVIVKITANNSIISFILPPILLIPFRDVLRGFDFGGKYGFLLIVIGTLLINIFTWSRVKTKK
jgi:hypothetical protein